MTDSKAAAGQHAPGQFDQRQFPLASQNLGHGRSPHACDEKTIFVGSHASWRRLGDAVHANSMHVVPVAPDIDPALVLTDGAIRAAFAPTTLEAGRIYELRGRVRNLRITNAGGLIFAETQGTAPDPYLQRIMVGRGRNGGVGISGMCSCPVGRDCKHVAAVLVAAHREELAAGGTDVPPLTTARPETSADPLLPYDLAGWLSTLHADDAQETEDFPPSVHQRLHYVLSSTDPSRGVPALVVRPFTVRLLATGKVSHPKQYALHQVGTPARYLRPSDRIILARLRRIAADQINRATDEDPVDTLRRVIATGRAFWGSRRRAAHDRGQAAQRQRGVEAGPGWDAADGVGVGGGAGAAGCHHAVVCRTAQRRRGSDHVGFAEPRGGAAAALPAGAAGTDRTRDRRASATPAVAAGAGAAALPAAEQISGEAKPYLRLINGTLPVDPAHGRGSARHVGGGLYEVPLARLAFRYGPLTLAKHDPAAAAAGVARRQAVRPRARSGRRAKGHRDALTLIGFGRVAQLAPVYYQHAHTDDFALNEAAGEGTWLAIVLQIVPELRAEGWDVEVDDDFPIHVVTPDSDLSAELEESTASTGWNCTSASWIGGERRGFGAGPGAADRRCRTRRVNAGGRRRSRRSCCRCRMAVCCRCRSARIRPTLRALMELYAGGGLGVDG